MKAYFTASIYHRDRRKIKYEAIINCLKKLGITKVYSEDILETPSEVALDGRDAERKSWFTTWKHYIQRADFAVAEISYPSTLNVGFEIHAIIARGKPVIALFEEGEDPVFTSELHSPRLIKSTYSIETLPTVLTWAIGEVKELVDKRFTFLIPPDIADFLKHVQKQHSLTASDFIRDLIRKEMEKNQ